MKFLGIREALSSGRAGPVPPRRRPSLHPGSCPARGPPLGFPAWGGQPEHARLEAGPLAKTLSDLGHQLPWPPRDWDKPHQTYGLVTRTQRACPSAKSSPPCNLVCNPPRRLQWHAHNRKGRLPLSPDRPQGMRMESWWGISALIESLLGSLPFEPGTPVPPLHAGFQEEG